MIESRVESGVHIIELARAEKRNAMLPEMLNELKHAIDSAQDALAITLIGQGKTFCAGFDLKACAQDQSGDTMRSLLSGLSDCVRAMREHPALVVLGVHGAAVAGGCALLGGADVIVADRNAKLGYPVVKIGVSPAVSSPYMLASMRPGVVRARLLDTDLIDGTQALGLGMVHELCEDPGDVGRRAIEIAELLASKPGSGCRATKHWLNEICGVTDEHAFAGLNASLELSGNEEERERLAALWG